MDSGDHGAGDRCRNVRHDHQRHLCADSCGGCITWFESVLREALWKTGSKIFVAGFIGSPAMNFLTEARVVCDDGGRLSSKCFHEADMLKLPALGAQGLLEGDSICMALSPKRQAGRRDRADGNASPNPADRPTVRLPFRPVGAPVRCPAPSSPPQATPTTASLGQRLAHLAQAAFINPNFAWLWWGQAISSVGDYAWDTALVLCAASFLVARQSWAPLAISGLVLAAAVPQIVVGPLAGVFVDRWEKRQTMVSMAALQAIVAVLLVLPAANFSLPLIGRVQLPLFWRAGVVHPGVVLPALLAPFFLPGQFASLRATVPQK